MADTVLNVLFVDDEKFTLKTLERELANQPFTLHLANSGKEALEILLRHEVAVVATDLMMPVVGGQELLNIVKNDYPETVRVIFSGSADRKILQRVIEKGDAYGFFLKPFKFAEEINPKLNQFLDIYNWRKAQKSLKEALISVLEISRDGFVLFNDVGDIVHMNLAAKRMLGSEKEVVKDPLLQVLRSKSPQHVEMKSQKGDTLVLELIQRGLDWRSELVNLGVLFKQ